MNLQMIPLEQCPVCKNRGKTPLFKIPESQVFQCTGCGVRYLDPCLSPAAMVEAYQSADTLTRFHQFHKAYYNYGKLGSCSKTERDFIRGLEACEKVMPDVNMRSICDVGYGNGFFLAVAKQRGWRVDGIDTSNENQKLSDERFGLKLRVGDFLSAMPEMHRYDVISFWDVLEHVPDPYPVLQKTLRLLNPNGVVLIAVPNDRSFLRYCSELLYSLSRGRVRAGLDKSYFVEHPVYYSRDTLVNLLDRNGFKLRSCFFTSTDLDKYVLSFYERLAASWVLTLGRSVGLQNRLVATFQRKQHV